MDKKYNEQDCIALLCNMQAKLDDDGVSRYPRRSDFTAEQVTAIKAFLGPWPRALEKAGIKPENEQREIKRTEKHIELKRKKTSQKLEKRSGE